MKVMIILMRLKYKLPESKLIVSYEQFLKLHSK